jgi:cytochrome c peroxidase
MNAIGADHLVVGAVVIVFAALVMYLLVHRELAPQSGLHGRGEWWLAAGLGMGVVAFITKMLALVVMTIAPSFAIDGLIAGAQVVVDRSYLSDAATEAPSTGLYTRWQALPAVAPAPADNPQTLAKIALGERLFHDPALSINREVACASCHNVRTGAGDDGRPTSTGIAGQRGARNAPTVFNAAFQPVLFWDGRAASLEEQAKGPLVNPVEMGMPDLARVEARVREDASYPAAFAAAFDGDDRIDVDRIAAAIASFERTLITPDTPYDRFVRGDRQALTEAQLRGMALFDSIGCTSCHAGANFSGAGAFDTAALWRMFPAKPTEFDQRFALTADSGRAAPGSASGVWRVPSLRNVALTAPYMHNGRVSTLDEAVRIMAAAQLGRQVKTGIAEPRTAVWSSTEARAAIVEHAPLTEADVADIVTFLQALTSDHLRDTVAAALAERTNQHANAVSPPKNAL